MTDYLTEQEQIELLKSWIKQYSLVVLLGVVLAVSAISGWRYWQQRQQNIQLHASAIYDELLTARAQNDNKATLTQANKLFDHYPQTSYGQLAALMLAHSAVDDQNYPKAQEYLNWVLSHSNVQAIQQIARLRLARILIAIQKPNDALTKLNTINDKTFIGLIDETRGDAYLSLNDTAKAREAYQKALNELPNADVIRPILRMKYDNLAITQRIS